MAEKKTKEIKPPKPSTEREVQQTPFSAEFTSLEEEAKQNLDPVFYKKLKRIAYYVSKVGLSTEEACLLVNISYDKFIEDMKINPLVEKVIKIKELEYKKDLLLTVSLKAGKGKDDKLAQWLLERKWPLEFGPKKSGARDGDDDLVFEAITFVQKSGDSTPLVQETAGKAISIRKGDKSIVKKIEDILA